MKITINDILLVAFGLFFGSGLVAIGQYFWGLWAGLGLCALVSFGGLGGIKLLELKKAKRRGNGKTLNIR